MKSALNLLWALLFILGTVELAHVEGAGNLHKVVNGRWMAVAV